MFETSYSYLLQLSFVQIVEHVSIFILLGFCLYMFFRGSNPFNRGFFPLVCILAITVQLVTWATYRDEPEFMSFIVERIVPLLPGSLQFLF